MDTEIFFARQKGLLMMYSLQSTDIHNLIVKNLNIYDIKGYVNTAIIVSKHLQKETWSQPQSNIPHNSEKIIYHLEDEIISVDYIMYIDYSFSTLWKRMPKTNIYINLIVELILIYIIILFIRYHRKYRKKTSVPAADTAEPAPHIIETIPVGSSVETEKQTDSTIKEELSLKDQFVFEKDFVLFKNHPIKMPNQQQKILTFFLNSPNYRINKSDLKKEFWPQNSDQTNNIKCDIKKLKRNWEEISSKYTIITDKKNEECYILVDDKTT